MEKVSDPPGTRRSASGRLIDSISGKFVTDPNKVKKQPTTRRARSRRSTPASEIPDNHSRSLGEVSDGEENQRERQVPRSTLPDSATIDKNRRLIRKTSLGVSTRVTERQEYDQVQAQLRQGDPIRLDQPQEQSPGGTVPPLMSYLTQGREESTE
eukprot:1720138-Amphidinium_carterae.2